MTTYYESDRKLIPTPNPIIETNTESNYLVLKKAIWVRLRVLQISPYCRLMFRAAMCEVRREFRIIHFQEISLSSHVNTSKINHRNIYPTLADNISYNVSIKSIVHPALSRSYLVAFSGFVHVPLSFWLRSSLFPPRTTFSLRVFLSAVRTKRGTLRI